MCNDTSESLYRDVVLLRGHRSCHVKSNLSRDVRLILPSGEEVFVVASVVGLVCCLGEVLYILALPLTTGMINHVKKTYRYILNDVVED